MVGGCGRSADAVRIVLGERLKAGLLERGAGDAWAWRWQGAIVCRVAVAFERDHRTAANGLAATNTYQSTNAVTAA
jgi:hypothetical protein